VAKLTGMKPKLVGGRLQVAKRIPATPLRKYRKTTGTNKERDLFQRMEDYGGLPNEKRSSCGARDASKSSA
jgi:hypothetical protein